MKLMKVYFDRLKMFEGGIFDIDLFASDRVPASDGTVHELSRPHFTNNVVALAGINASGKSTALNLIELACRIVSGAVPIGGGVSPTALSLFEGGTLMRCLVWSSGSMFLVESQITIGASEEGDGPVMSFDREAIFRLSPTSIKKSTLSSWEGILAAATPVFEREDVALSALDAASVSFAGASIGLSTGTRERVVAVRDQGFRLLEGLDGIDDVLRVFDPSIEHLAVMDSGRAFVLKFAGREPMTLSEEGLREVLSSGTMRGLGLVQRATLVLRHGGYLLVDEIENHLNRQLVNVVMDLFAEPATNPNGATLVLTTHYPQLLDHVHRKDNVYFLIRGDGGSRAVKYSEKVKRIENKKSEVFASNYVKGTAPRYADVRALKGLVESEVSHG